MHSQAPRWSVVIPYYNERDFLPATLASLTNQTLKPFRLILVDNASTDGGREAAADALEGVAGVEAVFLHEARPGQVHALETGIGAVDTPLVAICDADTRYPPDYLARADRLFERFGEETVAVLAFGVAGAPHGLAGRLTRAKGAAMGALLARQCHAGGYGHAFRTAALRAAGGYSCARWPHVLKDHELMHRVMKVGRVRYDFSHWCVASDRRADRGRVRWTLPERLLYHVTPYALKDWFFYRFLAPRFARRRLDDTNLRAQPWRTQP